MLCMLLVYIATKTLSRFLISMVCMLLVYIATIMLSRFLLPTCQTGTKSQFGFAPQTLLPGKCLQQVHSLKQAVFEQQLAFSPRCHVLTTWQFIKTTITTSQQPLPFTALQGQICFTSLTLQFHNVSCYSHCRFQDMLAVHNTQHIVI